VLIRMVG